MFTKSLGNAIAKEESFAAGYGSKERVSAGNDLNLNHEHEVVISLRSSTAASVVDGYGKFPDRIDIKIEKGRPGTEIRAKRQVIKVPIHTVNSKKGVSTVQSQNINTDKGENIVHRISKNSSNNNNNNNKQTQSQLETNEIIPKLQRPRSRKLYLGSGKDLNNHGGDKKDQGDNSSTSVRLERPKSRKLYLGSKNRPDLPDEKEQITESSSTKTKRVPKSAGSSIDRPRLKRLSSFSGFSTDTMGLEGDEEPKERPPSRQSSAFPVNLADSVGSREGNRPQSGSGISNSGSNYYPSIASRPGTTNTFSNSSDAQWRNSANNSNDNSDEWKSVSRNETDWRTSHGNGNKNHSSSRISSAKFENNMDRSNLPTRGLSNPVTDGFTLLGEENEDDSISNWPFPIQINYDSSNNSNAKFSTSISKFTQSLLSKEMSREVRVATDLNKEKKNDSLSSSVSGQKLPHNDYVTETLDVQHFRMNSRPNDHSPSPPSGLAGARTPPQSHHGLRDSSLHHIVNSMSGSHSGVIPQSPITFTRPHHLNRHRKNELHDSTYLHYLGDNEIKSHTLGAPTVNCEKNAGEIERGWASPEHLFNNKNATQLHALLDDDRSRPNSVNAPEMSYNLIDDDIYEDESDGSDSDEDFAEDSDDGIINSGNSEFLDLHTFGQNQDGELHSSLGEDFLRLFAMAKKDMI